MFCPDVIAIQKICKHELWRERETLDMPCAYDNNNNSLSVSRPSIDDVTVGAFSIDVNDRETTKCCNRFNVSWNINL